MKILITNTLLVCLSLFAVAPNTFAGKLHNCTYEGIPLYGQVKVSTNGWAHFDVRVANNIADLYVEKVSFLPDICGRWQFVDTGEDFTIRFVHGGEDFSIMFVPHLPGVHP